MLLQWYGHACFSMKFLNGVTVVTDPFDDSVGYPLCRAHADIALISHDHFDHNNVSSLSGDPLVIRDSARRTISGLEIYGLDTFHDDAQGAKRGMKVAHIIQGDGLRIAHLGDIGSMPTEEQYAALADMDILFIPIGGTYTISDKQAAEIIKIAKPHTAIAMHFKTLLCNFPITDERDFVHLTGAKYLPGKVEITKETLDSLPSSAVMLCPAAR